MRSLVHHARVSLSQLDLQVPCFTVLEAKRGHVEHAPVLWWLVDVKVDLGRVKEQMLIILVEQGLNKAELAVTHVDELGTPMQL